LLSLASRPVAQNIPQHLPNPVKCREETNHLQNGKSFSDLLNIYTILLLHTTNNIPFEKTDFADKRGKAEQMTRFSDFTKG
jgi:hypothetical protein